MYDRWGHLLFATSEINKGWDGKVKGEVCKEDVYVYKIRFCDVEKVAYTKIGHVTLLK
jgi:gliding motility-associated-like protein